MLGAKILMIIFDWDHFSAQSGRYLLVRRRLQAAGVYQGGSILAIVTAFLYLHHHKMPWLPTFDMFAPGVALGHAIGRIGMLRGRLLLGQGMRSAVGSDVSAIPTPTSSRACRCEVQLHPSQLYELVERRHRCSRFL